MSSEKTSKPIDVIIKSEASNSSLYLSSPVAPIENRIAYLPTDTPSINEWMDAKTIANSINSSTKRVKAIAEKIGISSQPDTKSEAENYPPLTLELVREEITWEKEYSLLDRQVSANEIADFLGRTWPYVYNMLTDMQVPSKIIKKGPNIVDGYDKKIIIILRELELSIPPDSGWLTITALSELTGARRDWIARRLEQNKILGEERKSLLTGRVRTHYPPESVELINELIRGRSEAAGNLLTAQAIKAIVGKTYYWVEARLERTYKDLALLRQDDAGRDSIHYPLSVLAELLQDAHEIDNTPMADGKLTVFGITKAINKTASWVNKRLVFVDAKPISCRDGRNMVSDHYDPIVIDQLLALPEDILDKEIVYEDGYITLAEIARKLERSNTWVNNRMKFTHATPEDRVGQGGITRKYYPPEIVTELASLPTDILRQERNNLIGSVAVKSIAA